MPHSREEKSGSRLRVLKARKRLLYHGFERERKNPKWTLGCSVATSLILFRTGLFFFFGNLISFGHCRQRLGLDWSLEEKDGEGGGEEEEQGMGRNMAGYKAAS